MYHDGSWGTRILNGHGAWTGVHLGWTSRALDSPDIHGADCICYNSNYYYCQPRLRRQRQQNLSIEQRTGECLHGSKTGMEKTKAT